MAIEANSGDPADGKPPHLRVAAPSPWIRRFAHLVPAAGSVLDVATGGGRHARLFSARGCRVTAVDRTLDHVADLAGDQRVELVRHDLETDGWPFAGRRFDGVIVTFYLHRPLLPILIDAVAPGGVLLYESLAENSGGAGGGAHPERWLRDGELLDSVRGRLLVVAYEQGWTRCPFPGRPYPGAVQRLCAVRTTPATDGQQSRVPPLTAADAG